MRLGHFNVCFGPKEDVIFNCIFLKCAFFKLIIGVSYGLVTPVECSVLKIPM